MIAKLATDGWSAVLDDNGVWSADNPVFERLLNGRFGKEMIPPSPSAGKSPFGRQAVEAAEWAGVKVEWGDLEDGDRDAVY